MKIVGLCQATYLKTVSMVNARGPAVAARDTHSRICTYLRNLSQGRAPRWRDGEQCGLSNCREEVTRAVRRAPFLYGNIRRGSTGKGQTRGGRGGLSYDKAEEELRRRR